VADRQTVAAFDAEDGVPPRRRPADLTALVSGVVFIVLAIVLMAGVELPHRVVATGGLIWIVLVGGGFALLVSELRKARRRRT
jgi:hypothetical protein